MLASAILSHHIHIWFTMQLTFLNNNPVWQNKLKFIQINKLLFITHVNNWFAVTCTGSEITQQRYNSTVMCKTLNINSLLAGEQGLWDSPQYGAHSHNHQAQLLREGKR